MNIGIGPAMIRAELLYEGKTHNHRERTQTKAEPEQKQLDYQAIQQRAVAAKYEDTAKKVVIREY